jgi:hypothetical protein
VVGLAPLLATPSQELLVHVVFRMLMHGRLRLLIMLLLSVILSLLLLCGLLLRLLLLRWLLLLHWSLSFLSLLGGVKLEHLLLLSKFLGVFIEVVLGLVAGEEVCV